MKKIIVLAVFFGLLVFAGMLMAKPAPPAMAHCPRIHAAVGALDTAIKELEAAGHDFCGHKEDALRDARAAREQLHQAEACDKCR